MKEGIERRGVMKSKLQCHKYSVEEDGNRLDLSLDLVRAVA